MAEIVTGNSGAILVLDMMSQSLRIKEEAYRNMFKDKEKVLKDSRKLQETIKTLRKTNLCIH